MGAGGPYRVRMSATAQPGRHSSVAISTNGVEILVALRLPRTLACATGLAALALAAEAQAVRSSPERPPWTFFTTLGFGGVGFGAGLVAGVAMSADHFGPTDGALVTIAAGTVAGSAIGAVIGFRGARRLAFGEPLSNAHRTAIAVGTVLGGTTLGALASVPFIANEQAGTPLGSDEQTFLLLAGAGTALGAVIVTSGWNQLGAHRLSLSPVVTPRGRWGFTARLTTGRAPPAQAKRLPAGHY